MVVVARNRSSRSTYLDNRNNSVHVTNKNSTHKDSIQEETIRIDKWLWTARFFKTRSLASEAVNGGKVHLNGQRVKAGRAVKVGDDMSIQKDATFYEIKVLGINKTRRPAKEAQQLYEETELSIARREQELQIKKLAAATRPVPQRRPDKRQREQLRNFKHNQ